MNLTFETELETDGRWIAEVSEPEGMIVYGSTQVDAVRKARFLALRVLAERIIHDETLPMNGSKALFIL